MMAALLRHWRLAKEAIAAEKTYRRGRRPREETAFLPAALEIVEQPVSPTARATAGLLLGALLFTLIWLGVGKIDIVASASGHLVAGEGVKVVQPAENGVVHAILVHDGQRVRAGQPLVLLDPAITAADTAKARQMLEASELAAARARALLGALDGRPLRILLPPGLSPEMIRVETASAQAQFADIASAKQGYASEREAARAAWRGAEIQAAKLASTLPLVDQQIAANEQMMAKGYVSKLKVIEMRRQRMIAAGDRDAALAEARSARARMEAAGYAADRTEADARAKILSDLSNAEADTRLREADLAKANRRSAFQTLVSPVDGTVMQLAIHTVGGVVEAAKPVMVIVPARGPTIAEIDILNRDIGFVHVGQSVAIKLEAFPFTRYGTLAGRIESIASDAVEREKMGLVYPARVRIDGLGAYRDHAIRPRFGMRLTADIRTGRRSLLSYLLSPIEKTAKEAGRER